MLDGDIERELLSGSDIEEISCITELDAGTDTIYELEALRNGKKEEFILKLHTFQNVSDSEFTAELQLLKRLENETINTPTVVMDGRVQSNLYFLMEKEEGVVPNTSDYTVEEMQTFGEEFAEVIQNVQSVDLELKDTYGYIESINNNEAVFQIGYDEWQTYLDYYVGKIADAVSEGNTRFSPSLVEQIQRAVREQDMQHESVVLTHNDLRCGNVNVNQVNDVQTPGIVAVFDWCRTIAAPKPYLPARTVQFISRTTNKRKSLKFKKAMYSSLPYSIPKTDEKIYTLVTLAEEMNGFSLWMQDFSEEKTQYRKENVVQQVREILNSF